MNNSSPETSLRTLMAVMVGLLVSIALGFALMEYRAARAVFRDAELMAARNHLADVCLETVNGFIAERGRTLVVLIGVDPAADTHRRFLLEGRPVVDDQIDQLLRQVPKNLQSKAMEVEALWKALKEIRKEVDRALALPADERDKTLYGRWLNVTNEMLGSLLGLLYESTDYPAIDDAGFEHLNNLRGSSVQLRTLIGVESSTFGANALSGRAFTPQEISMVRLVRSQSMIVWERLAPSLTRIADAPTLDALERLKKGLFGELRPQQDKVLQAAERGVFVASVGGSLDAYFLVSIDVTNAAGELTASIGQFAERYVRERVDQARLKELMALLGIGGILLVGGLAVALFIVRVARPLKAIQRRIDRLIERQSGSFFAVPSIAGADEVGRVNYALHLLDEALDARTLSEETLRAYERVSASILSSVPQAIVATDSRGVITLFSPGAESMLGYSAGDVIGKQTPLLYHVPEEISTRARALAEELGIPVEEGFYALIAKAQLTGQADEHEWTLIRKDGARLTVLLSVTVFSDGRGDLCCCGVATDITQRSQIAAEMSRLANYDPLTQLPNRRLFHDRISMAITQSRRENTFLGLMMIDIDRFKPVNDNYGHSVGDLLLKAVAERMQKCLRESDTLARVGGDEFVVILPTISGAQDAVSVAEKIRQSLCAPFALTNDIAVDIDCSIGIAIYPDHGANEDMLLKNADNAMYVAKALGRAQVHVSGGQKEGAAQVPVDRTERAPVVNLIWRRAYQCGDPTIDREHRDLFLHGNTLIRAVANGRIPPDRLPEMLDELIDSIMAHFRNEEFVLTRYGYEDLDTHAKKHQRLVKRALELRSMAASKELSLSDVVSYISRDIVAEHMLIDDHDYFPLLRSALSRGAEDTL